MVPAPVRTDDAPTIGPRLSVAVARARGSEVRASASRMSSRPATAASRVSPPARVRTARSRLHPRRRRGVSPSRTTTTALAALHPIAEVAGASASALDALALSSPVASACITSWFGFTVADVTAQTLALVGPLKRRPSPQSRASAPPDSSSETPEGFGLDLERTLANGLFGLALYGPTSSAWYATLDANVFPGDPSSAAAVAAKTALDQICWAPVLVAGLFAFDLARNGEALFPKTGAETSGTGAGAGVSVGDGSGDGGASPGGGLPGKLRRDLLATLKVNWSFWPLFHVVNFRFVNPDDRILYVNVVQVLFNVFLCWKASERAEGGGGVKETERQ